MFCNCDHVEFVDTYYRNKKRHGIVKTLALVQCTHNFCGPRLTPCMNSATCSNHNVLIQIIVTAV